jgi:hypothetical protein
VGFDYQNREVVAQELDGLMKLKPSLSQFLIYGPVPGTPFHERIMKDNLLQDVYTDDKDLFYRRADGFRTMIKHPTLSAEEIEAIQEWCFKEDFERLGPSIYRVLEARLLGYQKMKNSPNPHLRAKAEYYAGELRYAYPVFMAGRVLGPNAAVRRWIGDLERKIHAELGAPALGQRLKSVLGVAMAAWTGLTLKLDLFQHPKLIRNTYRVPSRRWNAFEMWEDFRRKSVSPDYSTQVELRHATQEVWIRVEGALSASDAEKLGDRIQHSLARCKSKLVLDFKNVRWDKTQNLAPLREKLEAYRSRIRVILPKMSLAHPELILLAAMFQAAATY